MEEQITRLTRIQVDWKARWEKLKDLPRWSPGTIKNIGFAMVMSDTGRYVEFEDIKELESGGKIDSGSPNNTKSYCKDIAIGNSGEVRTRLKTRWTRQIGDSRGNALKLGKELRRPIVMPKPSAKEKIWKARQFRCQCGHSDRMHPDNYCAVSGCHCVKFDTRPKNKPEFKSGGLSTCRGRHGSKTEDLRMVEPKPENKEAKS
jgi:hypothetical protein